MYRKFTIADVEGNKIEFECHPDHQKPNFMIVQRDEIGCGLQTRHDLLEVVVRVSKFMDGNTINRLEVEEVEE